MSPIKLFLEYVIQNLIPLNEYKEPVVNALVKHYLDQAKDYPSYEKLTPEQLKKWIARFDKIKDVVKKEEGLDLFKQQGNDYIPLIELPDFIQFVTRAEDVEAEPESGEEVYTPDTRPNVIYTSDDGKIAVYKADSEDLCIRFKRQEAQDVPWCIARSSYNAYRYDKSRGFPVFYLAKNETLDSSDPLSAVAIQVTDPKLKSDSARYRWTNRKNSPHESPYMSWSRLISEIPWLEKIPDAKQQLSYVELTPQEKEQVRYGDSPINLQVWLDSSNRQKVAYLDARASRYKQDLFNNISDENFAARVLPRFPEVAQHAAQNVNILSSDILMRNYEKYPKDVQKSIISNRLTGGKKLDPSPLKDHSLPFQACLDITDKGGWNDPDKYYYSTKDRNAIIGLETDNNGKVTLSIYTPKYVKEDVRLSERTAKFIQQNSAPSKIPINDLNGLIKAGVMTPEGVLKSFEDDKRAPVAVKREEDGDFVLDSRTLGIYKVDDEGFSRAPEDAAISFEDELNSPVIQKKAVSIIKDAEENRTNLSKTIDGKTLTRVLSKIPYEQRTFQREGNDNKVIITVPGEYPFTVFADPNVSWKSLREPYVTWGTDGVYDMGRPDYTPAQQEAYITYLKKANKTIKDDLLKTYLDNTGPGRVKNLLDRGVPLDPNNTYVPIVSGDTIFLINKNNPSENYRRGSNNTRLVSGKLSSARAQQMLQAAQPQAATQAQLAQRVQAARAQQARGEEPAAQEPAAGEQPAAPVAAPEGQMTGAQIQEAFAVRNISYTTLPNAIRNRIAAGGQAITQIRGDRGAERRNILLGNRGRVAGIIRLTGRSSAIYFIILASGANIASIALQPGNYQYIATANNSYQMRSIENLSATLQARNINEEIKGVYVREFLANNPSMVNEVKACTQKYLKEKNMKKPSLDKILAEVLKRVMKENTTTKPVVKPDTKPTTKPGPTITPKPGTKDKPAKMEKNEATAAEKKNINKIVSRYKSLDEKRKK